MKTVTFGRVGHCLAYVGSTSTPQDKDFDEYIAFLRETLDAGLKASILVVTAGGAPTAAQRQKLSEVSKKYLKDAKVAVVTDSAIARGAVTALSWFAPVYRAFSMAEMDSAMVYLGVTGSAVFEVRSLVRSLQKDIGIG